MPERYLTPEEAASQLAVSPKTLRQWLRSGRIKGVKAGRLWRLREEDLAAFLVVPHREVPGERIERVRSARGMFAGSSRSLDDFLREKHQDTEAEERRRS